MAVAAIPGAPRLGQSAVPGACPSPRRVASRGARRIAAHGGTAKRRAGPSCSRRRAGTGSWCVPGRSRPRRPSAKTDSCDDVRPNTRPSTTTPCCGTTGGWPCWTPSNWQTGTGGWTADPEPHPIVVAEVSIVDHHGRAAWEALVRPTTSCAHAVPASPCCLRQERRPGIGRRQSTGGRPGSRLPVRRRPSGHARRRHRRVRPNRGGGRRTNGLGPRGGHRGRRRVDDRRTLREASAQPLPADGREHT
jgi:hypothetical protein